MPPAPQQEPLSDRQADALNAIKAHRARHGISPTYRELGVALGITMQAVKDLLDAAERKGWIERQHNKSRSIRLVGSQDDTTILRRENAQMRERLEGIAHLARAAREACEDAGVCDLLENIEMEADRG